MRLRQQQDRLAVFEHVHQAVLRVARVERHVGAARLENGHQRDHHVQATLHGDTYQHLRAHASLAQFVGQLVGPYIERSIRERLLAVDKCNCAWRSNHLRLEQLMDTAVGRVTGRRAVPVLHDTLMLCGIEQRQVAECSKRVTHQRVKQRTEVMGQLLDCLAAPVRTVMPVLDSQAVAKAHQQGQRIVGLLAHLHWAKLQATRCALPKGLGHRVTFEHHQAVEQGFTAKAGPALHVVQRRMFVFTHGQVAGLHLPDPLRNALLALRCTNHRQGVDEQADLRLHARQLRWPAGDRCTEADRRLPGIALQQQQPGSLYQGVDGDTLGTRKGFNPLGTPCTECLVMNLMALAIRFTFAHGLGQARRLVEAGHLALPEPLCRRPILALQPGDVVTVASRRCHHRFTGMTLQHLTQQLRGAPAIHKDVVAGEDQVMTCLRRTHQHQAQQGCLDQIEATLPVGFRQVVQLPRQLILVTPVIFAERQCHLLVHDLHRLAQVPLPDEAAAQDVVGLQGSIPGLSEGLYIQAIHIHAHLVDVVAAALLVDAVEQHALLHRRQRVDVGDLRHGNRQLVELRLGQVGQREVGRGQAAMSTLTAMLDDFSQGLLVSLGQLFDGFAAMNVLAEGPLQA